MGSFAFEWCSAIYGTHSRPGRHFVSDGCAALDIKRLVAHIILSEDFSHTVVLAILFGGQAVLGHGEDTHTRLV
jgi:hypothetical protein